MGADLVTDDGFSDRHDPPPPPWERDEWPDAEAVASTRDRDAWLRARRPLLGASEVASVLGLSPWSPAIETWARKTTRYEEAPDDVSEPMRIGNEIEPWLLGALERRTGCQVQPAGRLMRSRRWPWLGATLDGTIEGRAGTPLAHVAGVRGAVEVKSAGGAFADQWQSASIGDAPALVPAWYLCQVDAQIAVTGAPYAVFGALLGGRGFRFRWTIVERNEARIAELVERTGAWWRAHVEADVPPEPDGSERAADVLARLYPEAGGIVTLDESAERDVEIATAAREQIRALEAAKRAAEQRLRLAIGKASAGELPHGGTVRLATIQRKAYAVEAASYRRLTLPKE